MPNVIDLTTVAAVNGILLQGADVDAAFIGSEITAYSQSVLTRTGRSFLSGVKQYSERYNGSGSQTQMLKNYPILAVASLVINGQAIPASPPPYTQGGYIIDQEGSGAALSFVNNGGSLRAGYPGGDRWTPMPGGWGAYGNTPPLGTSPYWFTEGVQNVAVTYTAGYTTDVPSEEQTIPASPGPYTVEVDNADTFYADAGVSLASDGTPLTAVASSPGPMEYVPPTWGSVPRGTYGFNAAQQGVAVNLAYSYGAPPFDLSEAAARLVALQYRRRKWVGQTSQMQPGVGTTAYLKDEMDLNTAGIIERYKMRFLP